MYQIEYGSDVSRESVEEKIEIREESGDITINTGPVENEG